jgi:hypothetical protein
MEPTRIPTITKIKVAQGVVPNLSSSHKPRKRGMRIEATTVNPTWVAMPRERKTSFIELFVLAGPL